jgi:hypothetical protein
MNNEYTRRLRHMNKLSCNILPPCHYDTYDHTHTLQDYPNYSIVPCNNPVGPGQTPIASVGQPDASNNVQLCVIENEQNVAHVHNVVPDHSHQKYMTKTIKKYKVVPTKNGTVGFLVEKSLPFAPNMAISCSIENYEDNFFNGVIFDYDSDIGFLSIGNIDNITGDFSESSIYDINLIFFDPEVVKLKKRMEMLYKHLFQVDLETNPNYDPVDELIKQYDVNIHNLFTYLFNYNMRIESNYAVTEDFLNVQINQIYQYFFNVNIVNNVSFNPNGNGIIMDTLRKKIHELYKYLFSVDLAYNPIFNPN